ncbi:MAG: hypothetical protein KDE58_36375, partial [Caldilineaceae bacterium]|nr:hypothetical protein [Caldilineaceae bacterium]
MTYAAKFLTPPPNTRSFRVLCTLAIIIQTILPTPFISPRSVLAEPVTLPPNALASPNERDDFEAISNVEYAKSHSGKFAQAVDPVDTIEEPVPEPPPVAVEWAAQGLPLPYLLTLEVDHSVIQPGQVVNLTLNAWRVAPEPLKALLVTIELPAELKTERGKGTIQWTLSDLALTTVFSQTVGVQLIDDAFPFESAITKIRAYTSAVDGYAISEAVLTLGIESRVGAPSTSDVAQVVLREKGAVLRGKYGDVALLIEPAAASEETYFQYIDRYRWEDGVAFTETHSSIVIPVSPIDDKPSRVLTAEDLLVDNGVPFARLWQLDATYQEERIKRFDKRIELTVDVAWLLARGVDPEQFTLYTREDAGQAWSRVPNVRYDDRRQAFVAKTSHFSEYGLGLNNETIGDSLPEISAFSNDLFTGAATVNYPIDLPVGPVGMGPALSLNYSSANVDAARFDNNKNTSYGYRVQADLAGLGWSIDGLGYIAHVDVGDNGTPNRYSFVLGGTSEEFDLDQPFTNSFAKIEKNLQTVIDSQDSNIRVYNTGSWTVTTPDGAKHTFGGAPVDPRTPVANSNQGVIMEDWGTQFPNRVVNKWFLQKSVDSNGNYVEYHYRSDERTANCGGSAAYDPGWYYRAIRPDKILWGGNETTGLQPTMQVLFTYESRSDYKIRQWDQDCRQTMWSLQRLKSLQVKVWDFDAGAWRLLREYVLTQGYSDGVLVNGVTKFQHSILESIAYYGVTDAGQPTTSPLNTYSFTYEQGGIHSEVYLTTANNGWGGVVTY